MNEATRKYILDHRTDDVRMLALRKVSNPAVDHSFALDQIRGWQIANKKIPIWANVEGIHYPPHLSLEQCSSEQTARYKQRLCERVLKDLSAEKECSSLVDLTGGMGVDCSFMARAFDHACYVERQQQLCDLAAHNFPLLGLADTKVVCSEADEYLQKCDPVTMFFLDPARRDAHGGRTYAISDCSPDLIGLKELLLEKADGVLVKLSPMLDWHEAVRLLGNVLEVHIVSVGNECKEILLLMSRKIQHPLQIYCVDDDQVFCPMADSIDDRLKRPISSDDQSSWQYLYEPNASIMNAGCFEALERQFSVMQIAANSHLFVSDQPVENFPGRSFEVIGISTMNKQMLKTFLLGLTKANIAVRNFPMSVADLRKKLRLKEGGDVYIFATTTADRQHILIKTHKPSSL